MFTVYYSEPGKIKFHFITENSLNDVFTETFDVPYGVWVNLQMRMNKDGYRIVLSDLDLDHDLVTLPSDLADDYIAWSGGTPTFLGFTDNGVRDDNQVYMLNGFKG